MSLRVLAVILLGCCLVSAVSALSGPCPAFGPIHRGSLAIKSEYWGMSASDITAYAAAHPAGTSSESAYVKPPTLVLPTSKADSFSSLSVSMSTIGDAPTIPSTYSGALLPTTKPGFGGSANISMKTDLSAKDSLFM